MAGNRLSDRFSRGVFRLLLKLLPARFRERHGADAEATFAARLEERADRGVAHRVLFLARELAGVLGLAWRARGGTGAEAIRRDVRLAVRTLARAPGFTMVAVLVLGLGIGGSVAIFSAVNAVLLRPLPVPAPDRLVSLWESSRERGWDRALASPGNYVDWRERLSGFEDIAAYDEFLDGLELGGAGEPRRVLANYVTGNFFSVLGVRARIGRTFTDGETWADSEPAVLLSWQLWQSEFGGDTDVVGRTVQLDRRDVRVVGVMPPGQRFPREQTEVWLPMRWSPTAPSQAWFRQAHELRVVGRLREGVSIESAGGQLAELGRVLEREHPELNRGLEHGLSPLREHLTRAERVPLLALLGAVSLLLLAACANVGGLVLVRGLSREREVAIRAALGASRTRVIVQLVMESAVLAGLGGSVGLALGAWSTRLVARYRPAGFETWEPIVIDTRVLLFALGATSASAILFGLAPALRAGRVRLTRSLRDAGRTSANAGRLRTGQALVVGQLALAVVLVTGAGLLTRSVLRLGEVDPGVDTSNVLTLSIDLPANGYDSRDLVLGFWNGLVDRAGDVPGVVAAGAITRLPLTGSNWTSSFTAEGWMADRYGTEVHHREATPGYFAVMRVPLLRGRHLDETDTSERDAPGVVINESLARQYFEDEDPIGRRVAFDRSASEDSYWRTIVGIVGDEHQLGLSTEPVPEFITSMSTDVYRRAVLTVRTAGPPLEVLPPLRDLVNDIDPAIPIFDIRTMEQVRDASIARQRFVMTLFLLFAGLALVLALVGIYGVSAQAARARTHEIGIRMALGARKADVQRLMVGRAVRSVAAGLGLGIIVSLVASRMLSSLLFRVEAADPATFAAVLLLLGGSSTFAAWMPVWSAARSDPLRSLRSD